jgi:ERCC4-type nuclease
VLQVDIREPDKIVKYITEFYGANFLKTMLPVGDIVENEKSICIERKSIGDFYGSVCSEHMWNQASQMLANYQNNYIIIAGDTKDLLFTGRPFHINVLIGAIASLNAKYRINTIWVENDRQLVNLALKLIDKTGEAPTTEIHRKIVSTDNVKVAMLRCIPSIGHEKAKSILEHFSGDIIKILSASKDELKEANGVGNKIAENIIKVREAKEIDITKTEEDKAEVKT